MKKLYVSLLALILLALVFFTFYGGPLYEVGKSRVSTAMVSTFMGEEELHVPPEALREDENGTYVYVLCSENGYSRTIYTVERRNVDVIRNAAEEGVVYVEPNRELERGDRVVTASDRELEHGDRVLIDGR